MFSTNGPYQQRPLPTVPRSSSHLDGTDGTCSLWGREAPDVCYSWWILSALVTLDRAHWIDMEKLVR